MRNLLTACLPALALFALGGCASTSGLTSSEDDGVYYSSKDHTTAVVSAAPVPASANYDEAANPDYNAGQAAPATRQNSGSDQYYDNTYTYMRDVPNYGVTSYAPYSPYTSLSYGAGYGGFGGGYGYGGYGGFSPYGAGLYDPFYSPYGYGYGSGISISLGFGRPFGYGGYGGFGGYGSPYGYGGFGGYGYGAGFYDPYYYGGPFYGGYYGRGGYYGNSYYGNTYNNGYGGNYDNRGNGRTYGHRTDRASDGRYSSGGVASPGAGASPGTVGGGRVRTNEQVINNGGVVAQPLPSNGNENRRMRSSSGVEATSPAAASNADRYNKPRRLDADVQPQYRNLDQLSTNQPAAGNAPNQGQVTTDGGGRGRWRDNVQPQTSQPQPQVAAPQEGQRRRGFFQNAFPQNNPGQTGQAAQQPARQRNYDQPRQQRTYEQPQQRTYEQPSYSTPSYGGGGGGGNSGGGGGGGRRGRN